jgi:hypothetical protein
MSNLPKKTNSFKNIINFKDLLTKEKNKDQNITNSRDSTHNTTNKCKIFKQNSLNNNLTNCSNLKKIPSSTTNIGQIKTYSKFKMHNIKSEKRLMVKGSKKKILNLLRNSEKLKVKKKRSFNGKKKEEEKKY